jgi:hypothetical protein
LRCSFVAAKRDCEQCDIFENELIHLREDLVDTLNAWVVKAVSSQLVRLYSPNKEPALVFFRHGIPLLYEGKYVVKINGIFILKTHYNSPTQMRPKFQQGHFLHYVIAPAVFPLLQLQLCTLSMLSLCGGIIIIIHSFLMFITSTTVCCLILHQKLQKPNVNQVTQVQRSLN